MKLQLNEDTLNAYINAALNEELDELFGSRVRKQSQRMITGKGWGNQRRNQDNLWGAANTNIDINADAESDTPQTLIGMIMKMDQSLKAIEQVAGVQSSGEDIISGIRNARGVKKSLLSAINALTVIANRTNALERMSGSNAIMENARDVAGYTADAAVGGNASIGNAANMHNLTNLQRLHAGAASTETFDLRNGQYVKNMYGQGKYIRPESAKALIDSGKAEAGVENGRNVIYYLGKNGKKTTTKVIFNPEELKALDTAKALQHSNALTTDATRAAMKSKGIDVNTGFWGKQVANIKNGAKDVKGGIQAIRGAKNAGNAAQAGVQAYHSALAAGKTATQASKAAKTAIQGTKTAGQILKGTAQAGKGIAQIAEIPLLLLSIADEAGRQAAQGRQRNIVRTYNSAAIIARRLANISNEIANAQGTQQEGSAGLVSEINVHRGMKSFDSIETGMQELSSLMQQIGGVTQGATHMQNRVIEIPQGLDLNTRQGVLTFQQWVNSITDANGNALITDKNGNTLTEDGIFGNNTNFVYDKIAQMLQQQNQPIRNGVIKESKAIETALANLERAAGSTGSGGNAYSSIAAMSGGAGASRLQNAQNIKNIIRTYPPVLNQYLNILSDSGANVGGLQPLNVDTRPHRNYSVKELESINTRIQELLQIARTVEIPDEQGRQNGDIIIRGTLPPKPVRQPRPQPNPAPQPNPTPEPELPELEMPEIEDEPIEIDDADIFKVLDTSLPDIPLMISPYDLRYYGIIPNDKAGRITKRELKRKINQAMTNGRLTPERAQELIRKVITDYRNGVAQQYTNPDGSVSYTTHKAQQAAKRRGETNINTPIQQPAAVPMNEQTFKKLIKQIILEELKR